VLPDSFTGDLSIWWHGMGRSNTERSRELLAELLGEDPDGVLRRAQARVAEYREDIRRVARQLMLQPDWRLSHDQVAALVGPPAG